MLTLFFLYRETCRVLRVLLSVSVPPAPKAPMGCLIYTVDADMPGFGLSPGHKLLVDLCSGFNGSGLYVVEMTPHGSEVCRVESTDGGYSVSVAGGAPVDMPRATFSASLVGRATWKLIPCHG